MSELLVIVAIIFLPGIIWARIDAKFAQQSKPSQFDLTLNIFVFGLTAYLITFLFYLIPNLPSSLAFDIGHIELKQGGIGDIPYGFLVDDILIAIISAIVGAPIWLAIKTYKLINKVLRFLRVTKRYGDEDVWDYILSLSDPKARYVNIRDYAKNVTYSGFVGVYSEAVGLREIVLTDVIVYTSETGEEMYRIPRLYLARKADDLTIEFPADSTYIREGLE